ncbi:putative 6-phosphogluconate dehydrogenase protein [Neofusicoccum parvum UCRNP2]|uniref:6-phosphogluconate dehydrogenase 2 n=2 Tax=Neofusicoccum parvum TaxID=310453 RepID=A0ACB5SJ17_9PEZI|nr:putative 6-phosphogluconate dehydrogenase protein [Neofusicoccum parvum UCRNP2]GME43667.1 6-phosphogluconate dehydrogenase 2 [Neofusicoccum parvum]
MAPQLAWIGLGNMGRGMCSNLVEKGNLDKPLIIFNRTQKRADDLSAKLPAGKSTVVSTVEEAVKKSDIIFTCVGDDKAINETIHAALANDVTGKLFVDCSTVHPETTDALAKRISAKGAGFVASPVFGAPAMADAGQLIFVLAGDAEWIEKVKPYTTGVMGKAIIDFSGQSHGKATLLKVIGNTFIFQMIEALSEGHALAEKSGLGTDNLHKFIETMFPGPYTAYSNRMRSGDYHKREEPLFQVDLARKDARHALSLAESSGTKMRAVEVCDSHLEGVQKHKGAKGDVAAIYGAVRQESGLPFEN